VVVGKVPVFPSPQSTVGVPPNVTRNALYSFSKTKNKP